MEREQTLQQEYLNPENVRRIKRGLVAQVESLSPDTLMLGAAVSGAASLMLRIVGRQQDAQFVGQWAPTLLLVGLYAKGQGISGERRAESEGTCQAAGEGGKEMH